MEIPEGMGSNAKPSGTENPVGWGVKLEKTLRGGGYGYFLEPHIGVSGERLKFLRLLQEENEPITLWETQVHNQGAQCKYEDFADELVRDQFIAGLTSEAGTKIHNGAVYWNFILTSSSLFETVFPWLLIQYLWPFFVVEIAPPRPSPLFPLALLTGRQVHSSWERSHLL